MDEMRLDREEEEVLETYEAGEWQSVEGWKAEAERYRGYARATFAKDRRVNRDLVEGPGGDPEAGVGGGDSVSDAGDDSCSIKMSTP